MYIFFPFCNTHDIQCSVFNTLVGHMLWIKLISVDSDWRYKDRGHWLLLYSVKQWFCSSWQSHWLLVFYFLQASWAGVVSMLQLVLNQIDLWLTLSATALLLFTIKRGDNTSPAQSTIKRGVKAPFVQWPSRSHWLCAYSTCLFASPNDLKSNIKSFRACLTG